MGMYSALMKHVHDMADRLTRREEKWRAQETKALEALQWCETLNDRGSMDRLCAIFERTGGLESPAIHQKLSAIFNDVTAPDDKDILRLQALDCLNRTDWSRARESRFAFTEPAPHKPLDLSMPVDAQRARLQELVTDLEKDAYFPRPRMG